jgi:hypothetical protein
MRKLTLCLSVLLMLLIPMGVVAKKKVTKPEIPQLQTFQALR